MSDETHRVDLTDAELALLDGRVSAKAQEVVSGALQRIAMVARLGAMPTRQAQFIADVVTEANKSGQLACTRWPAHYCRVCEKRAGYAKHKRSGRWHLRGQEDISKPLCFQGWELAVRGVVMRGYPTLGCCDECLDAMRPALKAALADVCADVAPELAGVPRRFARHTRCKCSACGWQGHKGQLRQLQALMGGIYPGGCPKCPAKNELFGPRYIEDVEGYVLVEVTP